MTLKSLVFPIALPNTAAATVTFVAGQNPI
jgi:hypothetical protein